MTTSLRGGKEAEMTTTTLAVSLDPRAILEEILRVGITHVVTVPDTHQRTLLRLLAERERPALLTVCTEDEAMGVNLGLYIGGQRPLLLIQNTGFYASMNTLRGLVVEARAPVCLLIGEFGRERDIAPADHKRKLVSLLEPTLRAWDVPFYRLEAPEDLRHIPVAFERSRSEHGPVALLVGAPTGEL